MTRPLSILSALIAILLAGCGGPRMDVGQMTAAQPVDLQSVQTIVAPQAEYRIGVGDKLDVRVFQVADLSFDELVVDTSGNINMPLIGAVRGAGRTERGRGGELLNGVQPRHVVEPGPTKYRKRDTGHGAPFQGRGADDPVYPVLRPIAAP